MELTHIRLLVRDFDACFRFYRDVLQFRVLWGGEGSGYANFEVGEGTRLALFGQREMAEVVGTEGLPDVAACKDRAMLIFETKDTDTAVAELRARGADIVVESADYPGWGIRAAYVRDPNGTLIELNSPLQESEWSAGLREASRRYDRE